MRTIYILLKKNILIVHQRQDVVEDGVGVVLWRGGGAGAGEELAGGVEGGEVEGIGGYLDVGDDAAGLVDGERQLHPTPVELGAALGGESAPAAIFPFGRGKMVVESANLWSSDYFGIIRIF